MIRDPHLTPLGEEQCRRTLCKLSPARPGRESSLSLSAEERAPAYTCADASYQVDLLLASPLRRALRTAELTFAPVVQRGLKIIALPMAEVVTDTPSDTGSDASVLRAEFGDVVDFTHLSHDWFVHEGDFATDADALFARATKLRKWIRDRSEKEICLAAHGQFNHFLSGEVDASGKQTTPWWDECELRTYEFVDDRDDAMLRETADSLVQRGMKTQGVD